MPSVPPGMAGSDFLLGSCAETADAPQEATAAPQDATAVAPKNSRRYMPPHGYRPRMSPLLAVEVGWDVSDALSSEDRISPVLAAGSPESESEGLTCPAEGASRVSKGRDGFA